MIVSRKKRTNENNVQEDLNMLNSNTTEQPAYQEDDEELIAVITAAIAASLNRSTHTVVVKSVRRTDNKGSIWNLAGRYDYISNKL